MPRSDPSDHRYNAWSQDTWTLPGEDMYRAADWSRFAPAATCGICHRDRRAEATCVACGDELQEKAAA